MSTYRDDLEAAMARAEAAEQETERLRKQLAELDAKRTEPARAEGEPPAADLPIPEELDVTDAPAALRLSCRWRSRSSLLLVPLLGIAVGFLVVQMTELPTSQVGIADAFTWCALVSISAALVHVIAVVLLNRTIITVERGDLGVRHGPLPWGLARFRAVDELQRLFVREDVGVISRWAVYAVLTSGKELRLVTLATQVYAHYVAYRVARYVGLDVNA